MKLSTVTNRYISYMTKVVNRLKKNEYTNEHTLDTHLILTCYASNIPVISCFKLYCKLNLNKKS